MARRPCALLVVLAAALLLPAPRPAAAAGLIPSFTSPFRSPVAAVAEAVRAYPSIFRSAREQLMLRNGGSQGDLSRTNGLFSIQVHDICPMISEVTFMSASVSCLAMSTLESTLRNRRAPGSPTECVNKAETGYGEQVEPSRVSLLDGTPAPVPLPDERPLPPAFSPRRTRALMYNEGATWAWHWGVINNILLFSMCAKGGGGNLDFLVPEGWEPVGPGTGQLPGIYDLVQTDGSPPMPFMALLKTNGRGVVGGGGGVSGVGSGIGNGSGGRGLGVNATNVGDGQLAIVFRGTNSGPEWMLDFQYHRIPRSLFPGPYFKGNYFDGETHAGFTAVFNMIWPHVRSALEKEVLAPGARVRHVTVSGHSLGAAVATLVSFAAQRFLDAHSANVTVGTILVASPNVGNLAFVQSHAALVNSRRITYANDVITMVPCTGGGEGGRGMPACNAKASQGGKVAVWTDYYPLYGLVSLTPKDMPVQVAAWENTDRIPLFDVPTADALTGALHVCAYECFFSRWSDKERAAQSSCLLVPPTLKESDGHSYCYGFPTLGFMRQ